MQFREEVGRAQALHTHYGRYMNNPRTVKHPNNRTLHRDNRWSFERNRSSHSRDRRSRSLHNFKGVNASRNDFNSDMRGKNPNIKINAFVMDEALLTIFCVIENAHQRWQQSELTGGLFELCRNSSGYIG